MFQTILLQGSIVCVGAASNQQPGESGQRVVAQEGVALTDLDKRLHSRRKTRRRSKRQTQAPTATELLKVVVVQEVLELRIAQADAIRAYRDLSPYRIRLELVDDGWHIDYELKIPKLIGGGPHSR